MRAVPVLYNIGNVEERSLPKVTGSSAKGGALNGETSFESIVTQDGEIVNHVTEAQNQNGLDTKEEVQHSPSRKHHYVMITAATIVAAVSIRDYQASNSTLSASVASSAAF